MRRFRTRNFLSQKLAPILFASTLSLFANASIAAGPAPLKGSVSRSVKTAPVNQTPETTPMVMHFSGTSEFFKPEEVIYGFGAETDQILVTRDLTMTKPHSVPFGEKLNLLTAEYTIIGTDDDVALLTQTDNGERSLLGRGSDDSYIISVGSGQRVASLGVCGSPELVALFKSLPESETGCGVASVDAKDSFDFKDGTALMVADRDMEIALRVGTLKLAEGSVVLISNTEKGAAIFDFHDRGKDAVCIVVDGKRVALSPGRHMHLTNHPSRDFSEVNGLDMIGHRRVSTSPLVEGVTLHSSEFSTLSAMEMIGPLKKVMSSKHPEARKLAQQMIKTSAVLMHLGAGSTEDFKQYGRTRMTSLVNRGSN